jgi:oligosaccharide repeat unit polymerase
MLLLTIFTLVLLAAVNYRIGSRAVLYPPVVFCGVWAADLALVWMVGDFFYPLSATTLFLFLGGAFGLSAGSWLALVYPQNPRRNAVPQSPKRNAVLCEASNRLINLALLIVVVILPFYIRWIVGITAEYGGLNLVSAARVATLDESNLGLAHSFFFNMATLSLIVAALAFNEREGHRKRAIVAVALALVMNILTGAKTGGTLLLLALICLSWLRNKRLPWKFIAATAVAIVLIFATIEYSVHLDVSVQDSAAPIAKNFALYASGSMVAFDRVVREPNIIPRTYPVYIAFLHLLKNLGVRLEVPDQTPFVDIGPGSLSTNAYTMYWSYVEFGPAGIVILAGVVGAVITVAYQRALQGGRIAQPLCAFFFAGLVLSPFGEYFFTTLNFLSKLCAVAWIVYAFPVVWARWAGVRARGLRLQLAGLSPRGPSQQHPHEDNLADL